MDRALLLLGLLRQGDMHGYGLNEFIEQHMTLYADLKKSTAYFLLEKMEKQGWIDPVEEQQTGGRPPRRTYRVTAVGEAQFLKLLRETLSHYAPNRYALDAALAFAGALPAREVAELLSLQRDALVQARSRVDHYVPHDGSLSLILEHHRTMMDAELRWLTSVIARYEANSL